MTPGPSCKPGLNSRLLHYLVKIRFEKYKEKACFILYRAVTGELRFLSTNLTPQYWSKLHFTSVDTDQAQAHTSYRIYCTIISIFNIDQLGSNPQRGMQSI